MNRYLLNVSYIGTPFRGVQRQVSAKDSRQPDRSTVQGQVEIGLKALQSLNEPAVTLSSRTDAGVHALHTTMHTDLHRRGTKPYEPGVITGCLNQYFAKNELSIRILKTYLVPSDFHCRHNAISRTYLYRLVVMNTHKKSLHAHLPIEEFNRCLFMSHTDFDVDKLKEAAKVFTGYHDFRTFMHKSSILPDKLTKKIIEKCEIHEDVPHWSKTYGWPYCVSCNEADYKVYNIIIKANGFLYRQVRILLLK
ncbi:hypothetical protein RN001_012567 [Aquatica leii]|uniref:tRNA pseudouridine synthase n=1 Tax=Aquatica leii TaxID=1421715 RepID=A0AAN7NYL7_9COLE|nr:hypothetical protein RN001_012567 [Aquatica leii]